MKISVVIPAYNEEAHIDACLSALAKQKRKPDEIIVVDNNSTDKTKEIAEKYPVSMLSEQKQGISYARDLGFNAAHGDIIVRCDADCIPEPEWISHIEHIMKDTPYGAITGPLYFYDMPFLSVQLTQLFMGAMLAFQGFYTLNGCNMAIRKSMWNTVRMDTAEDDQGIQEDNDLAIVIATHGGTIGNISSMIMPVSARRIKGRPKSFFVDYPIRLCRTFAYRWKEARGYRLGKLFYRS